MPNRADSCLQLAVHFLRKAAESLSVADCAFYLTIARGWLSIAGSYKLIDDTRRALARCAMPAAIVVRRAD